MKYVEAIVQSKQDADKSLAPARAAEQQAAIGIKVAQLGLSVKTLNNKVEELKGQYPLNIEGIVQALDNAALEQRKLDQLAAVSTELFGS